MVCFCNETGSAMLRAVETTIIPKHMKKEND